MKENLKLQLITEILKDTEESSSKMTTQNIKYFKIGKAYFIETVTKYWLCEVVDIDDIGLIVKKCSWIPCTGRYNEAMKGNGFEEIEPSNPASTAQIMFGAITKANEYEFNIILEVK
jgi:hypothetical protein